MPQAADRFSGIFISYRREDCLGHAGRLYDRLVAHFGDEQIFMDLDQIGPGEDFVRVIEDSVGSCEILLALIGRKWLTSRGKARRRRLDDPEDFVRREIAAALARGVHVIPVLLQGAQMPRPQDLPEDLSPLAHRNALELSDLRWKHDVDQLIGTLEKILAGRRAARGEAGARQEKAKGSKRRDQATNWPTRRKWALLAAALAVGIIGLVAALRLGVVPKPSNGQSNAASTNSSPAANNNIQVAEGQGANVNGASPSPPAQTTPSPASTPSGANPLVTPQPTAEPQRSPEIVNGIGMKLKWIPPDGFMMGSNGYPHEGPVHHVTISEGFYMGECEVTQAQWRKVMGNNPSHSEGDNLPVDNVSWDDAQKFINKLNAMNDRYVYRLPTEAEWEYACRAGATGDYAGDLEAMAWDTANSDGKTHPVGSKKPNGFGVFDMRGNVNEWVQDYWHGNFNGAPTDGSAWLNVWDSNRRVLRGGSWADPADNLHFALRWGEDPAVRADNVGFRVAAVAR